MLEKIEVQKNSPDILEVEETIKKNFPNLLLPTKICLASVSTLLLNDVSDPTGIILQGPPSSEKTTLLRFFLDNSILCFHTDSFSPKAFVSHAASISEENLEKIDLLPKIKGKVFIVPEMSTVFSKRRDDLEENLSILTRLFDGEGLATDSGIRGHREYRGEYLFVFLGATTPLADRIWRTMGKLGNRWFFYNMPNSNEKIDELATNLIKNESYMDRVRECRQAVKEFLLGLFSRSGWQKSIFWDKNSDPKDLINLIVKLGKLTAHLRGTVEILESKTQDGKIVYSYNIPLIEDPKRAISILYNIARGHAIIHNRWKINEEDILPLVKIALSSGPYERTKLLNIAINNGGYLDYADIKQSLECSRRHAYRIMETLAILGLGEIKDGDSEDEYDKDRKHLEINKTFVDLFKELRGLEIISDVTSI